MFRTDRIGRRGWGHVSHVTQSFHAYEIKLKREEDYDEADWCNIIIGNKKITIELA